MKPYVPSTPNRAKAAVTMATFRITMSCLDTVV
jgi:hypothetical protein